MSIKTGNIQINFSNKESFSIVHEMIVAQLPSGKTAQDLIESAKVAGCTGGGDCESQYLHFGGRVIVVRIRRGLIRGLI